MSSEIGSALKARKPLSLSDSIHAPKGILSSQRKHPINHEDLASQAPTAISSPAGKHEPLVSSEQLVKLFRDVGNSAGVKLLAPDNGHTGGDTKEADAAKTLHEHTVRAGNKPSDRLDVYEEKRRSPQVPPQTGETVCAASSLSIPNAPTSDNRNKLSVTPGLLTDGASFISGNSWKPSAAYKAESQTKVPTNTKLPTKSDGAAGLIALCEFLATINEHEKAQAKKSSLVIQQPKEAENTHADLWDNHPLGEETKRPIQADDPTFASLVFSESVAVPENQGSTSPASSTRTSDSTYESLTNTPERNNTGKSPTTTVTQSEVVPNSSPITTHKFDDKNSKPSIRNDKRLLAHFNKFQQEFFSKGKEEIGDKAPSSSTSTQKDTQKPTLKPDVIIPWVRANTFTTKLSKIGDYDIFYSLMKMGRMRTNIPVMRQGWEWVDCCGADGKQCVRLSITTR